MAEASASPLRLLLIADRSADVDLLRQYIADLPSPRPLVEHVIDTQSACERLAANDIDVVMLVMDNASPTEFAERLAPLARLRETSIGITVLVLTDFEPDEHAAEQILQSANDYLVKNQLSPASLMRSIVVASKCQGLQRQLLDVLSASPDGMIVVDKEGHVLYVNQAGAAMFGRNCQGLQGELFGFPLADADRTEIDFGAGCTAEMRAAEVEWAGSPAHLVALRDVTERKRQEQRLVHLAGHDGLTGLMTRSLFCEALGGAIGRATRKGSRVAVLFLDLDRFKPINDTYGHEHGDELLKGIARRLVESCRTGEFVGRLAGDEFTALAEDIEPGGEAHMAERILSALAEPFDLGGNPIELSVSIGIAIYPGGGITAVDLLSAADSAMYLAKQAGGNAYRYYSRQINEALARRTRLEQGLRAAMQRDELWLCYQPKVSAATGEIVGVEALLRWQHPAYGPISPLEIISVAERTDLIHDLGGWVLSEACRQLSAWRRAGTVGELAMCVNVSARQLKAPDFVPSIDRVLSQTGIEPEALTLEITESVLIDDMEQSVSLLRSLGERGVRVAIDDFGTGFSSLQYLKRLPIHALKIDRSFVRDITTDAGDATIVKAVIQLAKAFGLEVVAEGVETEKQLRFIKKYGCDQFQGFLHSRPLKADALAPLLRPAPRQSSA